VAGGIATLSADARSEITAGGADVSLYKPENGPALNVFVGSHVHEYVTAQAKVSVTESEQYGKQNRVKRVFPVSEAADSELP
jgi:hypothetical protein